MSRVWPDLAKAAEDAYNEVLRSRSIHKSRFSSAHEGFAVLLEEVDELKAEVWKRQSDRDYKLMRKEAIQIAAMALRIATEIC